MGKKKILIVDDDKHMRLKMLEHLRKTFNVDCIEAENGKEGLAKMIVEKPDLVLLDVNMPVMDGMTVLEKIKSGPIDLLKGIPVIMLTGTAEKSKVMEILKMGVEGYIVKPVNTRKAMGKIKKVLFNLDYEPDFDDIYD